MTNAIFTMAPLSSKIQNRKGKYLLTYDKVSLLFKNPGNNANESPMRQVFLSMAQGDAMTRFEEEVQASTNANFCDELINDTLIQSVLNVCGLV